MLNSAMGHSVDLVDLGKRLGTIFAEGVEASCADQTRALTNLDHTRGHFRFENLIFKGSLLVGKSYHTGSHVTPDISHFRFEDLAFLPGIRHFRFRDLIFRPAVTSHGTSFRVSTSHF